MNAKARVSAGRSGDLRRLAVVDESSPTRPDGHVLYSMGAAHLTIHERDRMSGLLAATLNRRNPFHWESEGPQVRRRMVETMGLADLRLVCASQPCLPKAQSDVRAKIWRDVLLPDASLHGVDELVIEGRSKAENDVDIVTIRNWCRDRRITMFSCTFVHKSTPEAWLADAAAGIWADVCLGRPVEAFGDLLSAGVVRQVTQWDA